MLYFMVMGIRNYCNGSNANNGNKKFLESMSEINSRINGDESKNENGTRIELQSIEEGKQKLDHEYMDDMSKIKTENGTIIVLDDNDGTDLILRENKIDPTKEV
eukprot:158695_1